MAFTDDWDDVGGGERRLRSGDLSVVIRPDIEGWVLCSENPDFRWFAMRLEEMEGVVRFLVSHREALAKLEALPALTIRREIESDLFVEAARRHRGDSFKVVLKDGNGTEFGKYLGNVNDTLPSFVLGCLTIQGAEGIADRYRGKGIGDVMRDMAEEVMGLPAVPHGRNFTSSWLSESAARSWDRRAKTRHVPGLTPDIATRIRHKFAERSVEAMDRRSKWPRLADSVAVAAATAADLTTVTYEGRIEAAWVTAPNGSAVCTYGILDEQKLLEKIARDQLRIPDGGTKDLVVDRMSADESMQRHGHLLEGMIEYVAKEHRQKVDHLVSLIVGGNIPFPPQRVSANHAPPHDAPRRRA